MLEMGESGSFKRLMSFDCHYYIHIIIYFNIILYILILYNIIKKYKLNINKN